MNEQQNKILSEVQNRTTLINEDELLWIISILGVDGCDEQGNTFLHLAAARGFDKACKELLLAGNHSEHPNKIGKTPAVLALESGHLELALFINSHGGTSSKNGSVALANNRRSQSRGTFDPTPNTRLMNIDTEWSMPDDLQELVFKSDVTNSFEVSEELEALAIALSDKLKASKITPLHSSVMLYLRFLELIRNINECNEYFDDGEVFVSWVEETLAKSDAISELANRIVSETYAIRAKMHEQFLSLGSEIKKISSLLEWIRNTTEIQSICDRVAKIEQSVETRMSELRDLTSDSLDFADFITSLNISEIIESDIKDKLIFDAQQWVIEYGRKAEIITQLCKIVEGDLFLSAVSSDTSDTSDTSDIALLNPARKMIIAKDLWERFEKNDTLEDWDNKHKPQWNTRLWGLDEKR
jgi:hypothetical protein